MSVASMSGYLANSGGAPIPTFTYFNLATPTPQTPVRTNFNIISEADNVVPKAGIYIVNSFVIFNCYSDQGAGGPYIGTVQIDIGFVSGSTYIHYNNQVFTTTTQTSVRVQTSTVIECDGTGYIKMVGYCDYLSAGGTKINVSTNNLTTYPPTLSLWKIG